MTRYIEFTARYIEFTTQYIEFIAQYIEIVYKTSGMKIAHLTTRLPGYVGPLNEYTEAVIIHLGTNDIGDQANKAI